VLRACGKQMRKWIQSKHNKHNVDASFLRAPRGSSCSLCSIAVIVARNSSNIPYPCSVTDTFKIAYDCCPT
jgi:hypothetical protein